MAEKDEGKGGSRSDEKAADKANEEVQAAVDEETDQGFRGTEVDPTPNENYTVEGQLAGAPTPESDPKLAEEVGSRKFVGVDPDGNK